MLYILKWEHMENWDGLHENLIFSFQIVENTVPGLSVWLRDKSLIHPARYLASPGWASLILAASPSSPELLESGTPAREHCQGTLTGHKPVSFLRVSHTLLVSVPDAQTRQCLAKWDQFLPLVGSMLFTDTLFSSYELGHLCSFCLTEPVTQAISTNGSPREHHSNTNISKG